MDEGSDKEDYDQFDDFLAEEERGIKHVPRRRSTFPNDDIAPWSKTESQQDNSTYQEEDHQHSCEDRLQNPLTTYL